MQWGVDTGLYNTQRLLAALIGGLLLQTHCKIYFLEAQHKLSLRPLPRTQNISPASPTYA